MAPNIESFGASAILSSKYPYNSLIVKHWYYSSNDKDNCVMFASW